MYYFSTVLCTIMNSDIQLCNSSYLLTKKTLHSCMYVLGLKKFETGLLTVQWEYTGKMQHQQIISMTNQKWTEPNLREMTFKNFLKGTQII